MLQRTVRTFALLTIAAAALLLSAIPANAGDEYEPPPGIVVDDPDPDPGDTVTISGESCIVGATVEITVGGVNVGSTTVGPDGTFTFEYTVPADTAPGTYEILATGCTAEVLGTTITVGGATAPPPGGLPVTGSSSTGPLVRAGAVLIAAGAVLVFAVRRRQSTLVTQ